MSISAIPKQCSQCGKTLAVTSRFCDECGIAMTATTPEPESGSFKKKLSLIVMGIFGFLLLVMLQSRPTTKPEAVEFPSVNEAELQRRLDALEQELTPEVLREKLRSEYEHLIQSTWSHLNFINATVRQKNKAYELLAYHEFFSVYSFSSGEGGRAVDQWISRNQARLKKAQIIAVGVWGRGSSASGITFPVQ